MWSSYYIIVVAPDKAPPIASEPIPVKFNVAEALLIATAVVPMYIVCPTAALEVSTGCLWSCLAANVLVPTATAPSIRGLAVPIPVTPPKLVLAVGTPLAAIYTGCVEEPIAVAPNKPIRRLACVIAVGTPLAAR